jgi:membrane protein
VRRTWGRVWSTVRGVPERVGSALGRQWQRVDRFQQRHRRLAFLFAVNKKAGDDGVGDLASVIAFYGFFSLFPLLVLLVAILGSLLHGNPDLQDGVLDVVLDQFPDQQEQLADGVGSLRGSGAALVWGIVGSTLAGARVLQASQSAMDTVWAVPIRKRSNVFVQILRSLGMLVLLLLGAFVAVAVNWSTTFVDGFPTVATVLGLALSVLILFGLFLVFFRFMTTAPVGWGDLWPGALVAAAGWVAIERLGTLLLDRSFRNLSPTSVFVVALGLLLWLTLQARLVLYASEVNAVRTLRLWPRSLTGEPLTAGDRRALEHYAKVEARVEGEDVEVDFRPARARTATWQRARRKRGPA